MVKYENLRRSLIEYIYKLSSRIYQQTVWVERDLSTLPPNTIDDFDMAVHMLFDDTGLEDNPEGEIGVLLKNQQEVDAIKPIIHAIDDLLNKLGNDLTDEEYINDPDWEKVIVAAKYALTVFDHNRDDFDNPLY